MVCPCCAPKPYCCLWTLAHIPKYICIPKEDQNAPCSAINECYQEEGMPQMCYDTADCEDCDQYSREVFGACTESTIDPATGESVKTCQYVSAFDCDALDSANYSGSEIKFQTGVQCDGGGNPLP